MLTTQTRKILLTDAMIKNALLQAVDTSSPAFKRWKKQLKIKIFNKIKNKKI